MSAGTRSQALAFVALGSNLGDSRQIVLQGMDRLQQLSDEPLLRSSLWRTAPVDCPPNSPPFINAVAGLEPRIYETPESLLDALQQLEREFGRRPAKLRNEPRPLDLDLLAVGGLTRNSQRLILPHPRAHERRFVLAPLNEIAPELVLPLQTRTVAQLLSELRGQENVSRLC